MAENTFHVLYIDDDELMLKAVGRVIRRLKPDWTLTLIQDSAHWLDHTVTHSISPDLVVSDLVMPEIKGDELLVQVSQHFPSSIRALITGDTSIEINALTSSWTHFILPKPFTEKDFEQVLNCAERLKKLPFSESCRKLLSGIECLPVLPSIVRQLQRCADDDMCNGKAFSSIVANEPSLAGQVIKAANSAYWGFETKTTALDTAISRLGMIAVSGFALAMMSHRSFKNVSKEQHNEIVGRHQRLASVSVGLANQLGWETERQEKLYLVCLLSSIGELTLVEMGDQKERDSAPYLDVKNGYQDRLVICAYILILWGYDLGFAESVLSLQTAEINHAPHEWAINQVVLFCESLLDAQAQQALPVWLDALPQQTRILITPLLTLEH
ncbi:HDOD domain-containing protein [Vibrio ostreicida]|uniref:HDOD domain-containing protein n=1 Tax=Vibrio ostreicida TaxID=526588 RepID=UPI003B5AE98F